MIKSFAHKGLKKLFEDGDRSGLPAKQIDRITAILAIMNTATKPADVNFPGSDFHPLRGDRKGEYAVKITGNYRICFSFDKAEKAALDVNYEDYH